MTVPLQVPEPGAGTWVHPSQSVEALGDDLDAGQANFFAARAAGRPPAARAVRVSRGTGSGQRNPQSGQSLAASTAAQGHDEVLGLPGCGGLTGDLAQATDAGSADSSGLPSLESMPGTAVSEDLPPLQAVSLQDLRALQAPGSAKSADSPAVLTPRLTGSALRATGMPDSAGFTSGKPGSTPSAGAKPSPAHHASAPAASALPSTGPPPKKSIFKLHMEAQRRAAAAQTTAGAHPALSTPSPLGLPGQSTVGASILPGVSPSMAPRGFPQLPSYSRDDMREYVRIQQLQAQARSASEAPSASQPHEGRTVPLPSTPDPPRDALAQEIHETNLQTLQAMSMEDLAEAVQEAHALDPRLKAMLLAKSQRKTLPAKAAAPSSSSPSTTFNLNPAPLSLQREDLQSSTTEKKSSLATSTSSPQCTTTLPVHFDKASGALESHLAPTVGYLQQKADPGSPQAPASSQDESTNPLMADDVAHTSDSPVDPQPDANASLAAHGHDHSHEFTASSFDGAAARQLIQLIQAGIETAEYATIMGLQARIHVILHHLYSGKLLPAQEPDIRRTLFCPTLAAFFCTSIDRIQQPLYVWRILETLALFLGTRSSQVGKSQHVTQNAPGYSTTVHDDCALTSQGVQMLPMSPQTQARFKSQSPDGETGDSASAPATDSPPAPPPSMVDWLMEGNLVSILLTRLNKPGPQKAVILDILTSLAARTPFPWPLARAVLTRVHRDWIAVQWPPRPNDDFAVASALRLTKTVLTGLFRYSTDFSNEPSESRAPQTPAVPETLSPTRLSPAMQLERLLASWTIDYMRFFVVPLDSLSAPLHLCGLNIQFQALAIWSLQVEAGLGWEAMWTEAWPVLGTLPVVALARLSAPRADPRVPATLVIANIRVQSLLWRFLARVVAHRGALAAQPTWCAAQVTSSIAKFVNDAAWALASYKPWLRAHSPDAEAAPYGVNSGDCALGVSATDGESTNMASRDDRSSNVPAHDLTALKISDEDPLKRATHTSSLACHWYALLGNLAEFLSTGWLLVDSSAIPSLEVLALQLLPDMVVACETTRSFLCRAVPEAAAHPLSSTEDPTLPGLFHEARQALAADLLDASLAALLVSVWCRIVAGLPAPLPPTLASEFDSLCCPSHAFYQLVTVSLRVPAVQGDWIRWFGSGWLVPGFHFLPSPHAARVLSPRERVSGALAGLALAVPGQEARVKGLLILLFDRGLWQSVLDVDLSVCMDQEGRLERVPLAPLVPALPVLINALYQRIDIPFTVQSKAVEDHVPAKTPDAPRPSALDRPLYLTCLADPLDNAALGLPLPPHWPLFLLDDLEAVECLTPSESTLLQASLAWLLGCFTILQPHAHPALEPATLLERLSAALLVQGEAPRVTPAAPGSPADTEALHQDPAVAGLVSHLMDALVAACPAAHPPALPPARLDALLAAWRALGSPVLLKFALLGLAPGAPAAPARRLAFWTAAAAAGTPGPAVAALFPGRPAAAAALLDALAGGGEALSEPLARLLVLVVGSPRARAWSRRAGLGAGGDAGARPVLWALACTILARTVFPGGPGDPRGAPCTPSPLQRSLAVAVAGLGLEPILRLWSL